MSRKRVLEAHDPGERAKQRQRLGTLRELTVQPATRRRYDLALQAFFKFLRDEQIPLPKQRAAMDPLVCDYLEHLWSSGAGRGQACDTLASLQDHQPNLRHHMPGAWRLLKTWAINEIPNRAPPLPEHVLQAMVGWSFFHGHTTFGISLVVGFYSMLRTGELLGLRSSHILCTPQDRQALISLGFTKGGKRQGAAESVVLGYEPAVLLVQLWKRHFPSVTSLSSSPAHWRKLFNECLVSLQLEAHEFRPYSLRRGGATFWFGKHLSLDRILIQGRWRTQKSARLYLNEGLAVLATMKLPPNHPNLKPFIQVFKNTLQTQKFSTLEPPAGRAGGRGKKNRNFKSGKKKQQKAFWCVSLLYPTLSRYALVGLARAIT